MATENFELFDDRVLVKPNAAEEKTSGGIILSGSRIGVMR